MIESNKRLSIMGTLVKKRPGLGKTALMKFIYILQQVYGIPLGYDYELYTYGPYSSEVMRDIDVLADFGSASMKAVRYPSGHCGYEIYPVDLTDSIIKNGESFTNQYGQEIESLIGLFGYKTAKELELISTIVYTYYNSLSNDWDISSDVVCNKVKLIKPHFSLSEIRGEYQNLIAQNVLSAAS